MRNLREIERAVSQLSEEELAAFRARYPSLHFKKVGQFWSVRVGIHYRSLAVEDEENGEMAWFWIGSHAEYDRLLRSR